MMPRMGGRALKRQIERDLTTLSAEQLVSLPIVINPFYLISTYDGETTNPQNYIQLEFVESIEENWLPQTPDEKQGKRFYSQAYCAEKSNGWSNKLAKKMERSEEQELN